MDPYFKITDVKDTGYCDVRQQITTDLSRTNTLEKLYNVLNTRETLETINIGVRNDQLSDRRSPRDEAEACESNHQDGSSSEVVPITDFKMFYVLQNNNTQLKCYDQLKVLANFAGFIKKIGSK
jgi:hypothetical protein